MWMSLPSGSEVRTPLPDRSMAVLSLAMDEARSSEEALVESESGVPAADEAAVEPVVEDPPALAACLAACATKPIGQRTMPLVVRKIGSLGWDPPFRPCASAWKRSEASCRVADGPRVLLSGLLYALGAGRECCSDRDRGVGCKDKTATTGTTLKILGGRQSELDRW